jgi:radical SAM superfamily enzyme YgiQ (UPF0313 family)
MLIPHPPLLVSCYELGHQPLGIAGAAAHLRHAGIETRVWDASLEPVPDSLLREARFVGISAPMHTALRLGKDLARQVRRRNPAAHICFFGIYASLNRTELEASGLADSVLGPEPDTELVELVGREGAGMGASLAAGKATPLRAQRRSAPLPPLRESLPDLQSYAWLEAPGGRSVAGSLEASRGCKHFCTHCPLPPVYGGRFSIIPVETVLEDARRLTAAGARHLSFADPDFLNGPTHGIRVLTALHEEFPSCTFDFTAKVEHLFRIRSRFRELVELGCAFVVTAAESLSDRVLSILAKGHRREHLETTLDAAAETGLTVRPTWVPFTPWTLRSDYEQLLMWIAERGLWGQIDPVQLSLRLLVPPGSLLVNHPEMAPFLGSLDSEALTFRWRHPDPSMDDLQRSVSTAVAGCAPRNATPIDALEAIGHLVWPSGNYPFEGALAQARRVARDRPAPPRLTEDWFC